ncbi:14864_t:CDS:2, partial [Dentiscutata erythropus]
MMGCPWHINLAFSKMANSVRVNSIIGKYNHEMNPCIDEIAPRFRKLTNEILEKIKFWTIHETRHDDHSGEVNRNSESGIEIQHNDQNSIEKRPDRQGNNQNVEAE